MKKVVILALGLMFIGCEKIDTPPSQEIEGTAVPTYDVGEECGGILRKKCKAGLECKREEMRPEAKGVCTNTVVDKTLECDKTQAPVCGLKDGNKNGYLNECEAKRHGAEILHNWFCKKNESVKGNCEASLIGIGNCEAFWEGYEFDGENCVQKKTSGCDAEIPFETLQECKSACQ